MDIAPAQKVRIRQLFTAFGEISPAAEAAERLIFVINKYIDRRTVSSQHIFRSEFILFKVMDILSAILFITSSGNGFLFVLPTSPLKKIKDIFIFYYQKLYLCMEQ
jgi:hypothetical protein